ncbi:TMEM175 family protein [Gilvimarinus sp. SDUM040013]|uniref:TMEM175 family protein n=1 Tax=Gilvimarinus gilvus TaxID=3058038 RepID=A0ABU4RZC4_9GAMM|nr:TMEM175 family protein [Gilvimarinus sp. SDUM040013]MDO3387259.1 TMEM175 family protein [Gilvimarinus sp. SDUM040013]MDX6848948.1 TMEM175 family protein [Gilvimarinus sp. SDUM040013]
MAWSEEALSRLTVRGGMRLRGEAMTRMEVFSDAAFAFSLTMLVVSVGSIPQNFAELVLALKSIPAFAMSFAQLSAFWLAHRIWSNRYGLEDKTSTFLTLLMIFTVLVYVYPLRLVYSSFGAFVSAGWLPSDFVINSPEELGGLFIVYGSGYAALATVVALLYAHAVRRREYLGLDTAELIRTRHGIAIWGAQALFGVMSALSALLLPGPYKAFAGFAYFGLAVVMPWVSIVYNRRFQRALADQT